VTRVLIADDHPVVRRGLVEIVAGEPDMTVAGQAATGPEALAFVRTHGCDVVVLDLSLPGLSGLDVLKQLKHEQPRLPVLVLSMYPEDQFAVRVLRAGAAGYLTKESAPEELVRALRKVSRGGRYVSAALAEQLAAAVADPAPTPPHRALSDREYEVMSLLASGRTVKEVAAALGLSVKTVSTYRARLLEKMHMKTNADLTRYCMENRLI
jgi:DNA-binding NarL/FixJ family response regulator